MPIALIPIALNAVKGFFGRHPNKINSFVIYGLIAAVTAFFWFDYQGAKADRAELRRELAVEQANNEAFSSAIEEFQAAEERAKELAREVQRLRVSTEESLAEVRADVDANRIRELALEDEDEATVVVNEQLNGVFSLFDDATKGSD